MYNAFEEHSDGGVLTILYQHEMDALQIKLQDGTWIDVPVMLYDIVANTHKCLQRWAIYYRK